jgi:hypothetical protein
MRVWIDARVEGFADCPGEPPVIYVDPTLPPARHLEVAVHEALHACFPLATETEVDRKAKDISRWLSRLGYRRSQRRKK